MTDPHHEFSEWAGAFSLGALEPAERRAFEAHLEGCPICTDEVRTFLPLHGLLMQVDRADMGGRPDDAIARSIAARAGREHQLLQSSRRRWRTVAVSSAAAALLLAVAGLVVATLLADSGDDQTATPSWAEGPTVTASITSTAAETASISTSSRGWGTEVRVVLTGLPQRPQYQLWVVDDDGVWSPSSTWGPTPSGGADVTGATAVMSDALQRIVVTSQDRDEILIDASV